jgi:predicted nucleic acid-binding Zn ribbon protein
MLDNGSQVPFYEYRRPDGTILEVMQKMTDPPMTEDPETGVPLERVFHPIAVHFKGKGFYNTDYGTRNRQRENAKSEEGKKKAESSSSDSSSAGESSSGGESASSGGESSSSSSESVSKAEPAASKSSASESSGSSTTKKSD